jgi:chlorinating enzyme
MTVKIEKRQRQTVTVDDYVYYQREGYLIVRGLLDQNEVKKLQAWSKDIHEGKICNKSESDYKPFQDARTRARTHMLHRSDKLAEQTLLHPRVLDVLESLIGPDVLAVQSMLFFNPPGEGGQGWHQDAYYIMTQPNSLIGAWMALDKADQQNGCLWVAPGSHNEPVYPPKNSPSYVHVTEKHIEGLFPATEASNMDDSVNKLSEVAQKYGEIIPVVLEPGDVLFFHSHLLHRSYRNETTDRMRRAYVSHYCNARSRVPWNSGKAYEGDSANHEHILARGRTHFPIGKPAFGTPVELTPIHSDSDVGAMNVAMPSGDMGTKEM